MTQQQDLVQRVEHLLLRHEELQRTNALLKQQIVDLEQERNLLQMRLSTARTRIDSLLSRIPVDAANAPSEFAQFPRILEK